MAAWRKRLTDEQAEALREEIVAARKQHGNGTVVRIAKLAGVTDGLITQIQNGTVNSSVPSAAKIRKAIERLATEPPAPNAARRSVFAKRSEEQEPLRQRVRAIMEAQAMSQLAMAKHVGVPDTSLSGFLRGKSVQPKTAAKVERALTKLERSGQQSLALAVPPPRAPVAAVVRQQIDLVEQRIRGTNGTPAPSAVAIARQTLGSMGVEALRALLRIAELDSNGNE